MGIIQLPHRFKPANGKLEVNWTHPITRGLVWVAYPSAAHPYEIISGRSGVLFSGSTWNGASAYGGGLLSTSSTTGGAYFPGSGEQLRAIVRDFSIFVFGRWTVFPASAGFFSVPMDDTTTTLYPLRFNSTSTTRGNTIFALNSTTVNNENASLFGFSTNGRPYLAGATRQNINTDFFRAGIFRENRDTPGNNLFWPTTIQPPVLLNNNAGVSPGTSPQGVLIWAAVWSRALSRAEVALLDSQPMILLRPEPIILRVASGGAVTGTVSASLFTPGSSGAGVHGVSGTVSRALGLLTAAIASAHGVRGTVSGALANPTCAASGSSTTGTVSASLSQPTATGAGVHGVAGSVASTLGQVQASAQGVRGVAGTVSATLGQLTSAISARHGVTGTVSGSLANPTADINGTFGANTVNAVLFNPIGSAQGAHGTAGTVAGGLANPAATSSGVRGVAGSASSNLQNPTASISGNHAQFVGSVSATLFNPTGAVSARHGVRGAATAALANPGAAIAGRHGVRGAVAGGLQNPTCFAGGGLVQGAVNAILSNPLAVVRGTAGLQATISGGSIVPVERFSSVAIAPVERITSASIEVLK